MIESLEDVARRFCAYGIELKDFDGFTHYWCILLPAQEEAYETCIYDSANQTPTILEKGWKLRIPHDSLMKDFVEIHPTAASFKGMLDKARKHAVRFMENSSSYYKDKRKNHMLLQSSREEI
ncbi:hypothetical protein O181_087481 [Austropuccinia psidii MF-1]|uniref:Uncharacterized protein n=1 Tax=Austropuccinia psidii MF-1 TaxID=1389203 RepID=A0A9Q3IPR0_9BASI|nr:hypothetical protein [Austropuccinia psidii MF-1]